MATSVSELNVVLGARVEKLLEGLNRATMAVDKAVARMSTKADRLNKDLSASLDASGQKFQEFGANMSQWVTLPLAAMGAGAIKAAADIEALQLGLEATMKGAGRTIGEARNELTELYKVAQMPGIDFEQAVKGSIRLQNVRYSAEEARNILGELANAISMTGGTAHELDSVTRQFAQMISKGRILQEDMTIIQENMPAISGAMDAAFGTRSAEKLRDMGITAKQFVAGVTAEMAKLPRVSGGLQNSLVNMWLNIRLAAAKFGETLDRVFDIRGKLDAFGAQLMAAVDWFQNLDGTTQKVILSIGAFITVIGPASKLVGVLTSTVGSVIVGLQSMVGAFTAMRGSGIVAWFTSLNTVMRANIIGVVVTALLALGAAYATLTSKETTAAASFRATQEVMETARNSVVAQRLAVEKLTAAANNHNLTDKERIKALNDLKKISPEYFKNLKFEKGEIQGLNVATNEYVANLLKSAQATAAFNKIVSLYEQRNSLTEEKGGQTYVKDAELSNFDKFKAAAMYKLTGSAEMAQNAAMNFQAEANAGRLEEIKLIDAQIRSLTALTATNEAVNKSVESGVSNLKDQGGALSETGKAAKKYTEILSDLRNFEVTANFEGLEKENYLTEKISVYRKAIADALDAGYAATSKEVTGLMSQTKELQDQLRVRKQIEVIEDGAWAAQRRRREANQADRKNPFGDSNAPLQKENKDDSLKLKVSRRRKRAGDSIVAIQKRFQDISDTGLAQFGQNTVDWADKFEAAFKSAEISAQTVMTAIENASSSVGAGGDQKIDGLKEKIDELKDSLHGMSQSDPARDSIEANIAALEDQMVAYREKMEEAQVAALASKMRLRQRSQTWLLAWITPKNPLLRQRQP
jgi:tape measure domain-containing protein